MEDTKEIRIQFATVMWGAAEDFGGKLSKHGLAMRFEAMKEFSIEQIKSAGTWLLKNRKEKFPPVPTTQEFIDAIEKINGGVCTKTKAELEADKVFKKLREWGREAEPLFYDEITKYLMTYRWTFLQLDQMNIKDPGLKWFRKEFIEAYQGIAKESLAEAGNLLSASGDGSAISAKRLSFLVQPKRIEE